LKLGTINFCGNYTHTHTHTHTHINKQTRRKGLKEDLSTECLSVHNYQLWTGLFWWMQQACLITGQELQNLLNCSAVIISAFIAIPCMSSDVNWMQILITPGKKSHQNTKHSIIDTTLLWAAWSLSGNTHLSPNY
jgi:hypothetical protein